MQFIHEYSTIGPIGTRGFMGCIQERKHPSGRSTWKVSLRKKGMPSFYLTFDDPDEANEWLEKNEKKYYEDPETFFKMRETLYFSMTRKNAKSLKNILKPRGIWAKSK